ncbi:MAG: HAMP domain-containing histidine kinase [Proteobacteria bacterium]|nr:HAMP domain-containing histidine kinase [Pseudomonadota bacterium]
MIRLGLFQQLFWRVILLLLLPPVLLIALGHVYFQSAIWDRWRSDLGQEAAWTARHWGAPAPPAELARAWRQTHNSVRLTIVDAQGRLIADSQPEIAAHPDPHAASPLQGSAQIVLADGSRGVLTLSRARRFLATAKIDLHLALGMLLIVGLSVFAFYPMVRKLTVAFQRLGAQARRVADGHFGETIDPSKDRELGELIGAFNDMSLRLKAQDERKRRLIADVSHELRSPMARLRALGETIGRHPEEARRHLGQLEAEIALMDRLVGDMLETARFEEGRVALNPGPVTLADWAKDALERNRARIEQAGVACDCSIEAEGAVALFDPQRMVQVLGVLVENALAAVVGGPDPRVELAVATDDDHWALSVRDNGRGIPAEDLPFVFDRFFRVQTDRARATGGAGLGLSIAKAIMEAHGGSIEIESKPASGTVVLARMPLTPQFPHNSAERA